MPLETRHTWWLVQVGGSIWWGLRQGEFKLKVCLACRVSSRLSVEHSEILSLKKRRLEGQHGSCLLHMRLWVESSATHTHTQSPKRS